MVHNYAHRSFESLTRLELSPRFNAGKDTANTYTRARAAATHYVYTGDGPEREKQQRGAAECDFIIWTSHCTGGRDTRMSIRPRRVHKVITYTHNLDNMIS